MSNEFVNFKHIVMEHSLFVIDTRWRENRAENQMKDVLSHLEHLMRNRNATEKSIRRVLRLIWWLNKNYIIFLCENESNNFVDFLDVSQIIVSEYMKQYIVYFMIRTKISDISLTDLTSHIVDLNTVSRAKLKDEFRSEIRKISISDGKQGCLSELFLITASQVLYEITTGDTPEKAIELIMTVKSASF